MPQPAIVAKTLLNLLSEKSPELGSRLKQRLSVACVRQGFGRFNEREEGFRKFSDYLKSVHGNIIEIDNDSNSADVLISLRNTSRARVVANELLQSIPENSIRIRNDIWQAFLNPDTNRKRFINRETVEVRSYLANEESQAKDEVRAAQSQFIEIHPISAEVQKGWMSEFLTTVQISPDERAALEVLINEPYTSGVNATFSRALGSRSSDWRQFRTSKVLLHLREWSDSHNFALEKLRASSPKSVIAPSGDQKKIGQIDTNKNKVIHLLDLLSEEEIGGLVLPVLLSTLLIKSRID